jgi:glycine oxidase
VRAETRDERRLSGGQLVLAAGAWAGQLAGLPRPLPVEPVRGQMMSVVSKALRHVVYGGEGYVVPRHDGRTLLGATMERVGFDPDFTEGGVAEVRRMGAAIVPALAEARMLNAWAGLRPMTPDGLPILDRDPEHPALLYACGHSRNGVLMAPLTGDCIADLVAGEKPRLDLRPFSVRRFGPRGEEG